MADSAGMRLLLVDGNNVVHRCASVQLGVSRDRIIASAIRMIRRATLEFVGATHLIVAFDAIGDSFRRLAYAPYKANRSDGSEARTALMVEAGLEFESSGIFCALAKTFEADDVIATIARRIVNGNASAEAHVLSSDSDLLVLAGDRVHCWQFGRKGTKGAADEPFVVERTPAWICDRFGLAHVAQLTDFKALVGEPGDNLPGVRGVGPKKAAAMLKGYGSLAEINRLGALGPVAATQTSAIRELVLLRSDVPLGPIQPSLCRVRFNKAGGV